MAQLADRFGAERAAWIARAAAADQCAQRPTATGSGSARSGRAVFRRSRSDPTARTPRGGTHRRRACCPIAGSRVRTSCGQPILQADRARRSCGRSPWAPTRRRRCRATTDGESRASRCRHEVDGRLRRGRSGRHGAAHDRSPRPRWRAGIDSLVVFGVATSVEPDRHGDAARRPARRAPLHRRPRVSALRHADQQHRRSSRRRLRATTPAHRAASPRRSTSDPADARRDVERDCASARRSACRPSSIAPVLGRIGRRRRAARARHAQHEHGAVAGRLGLLPDQHDRLRRHRPAAPDARSTWARDHFVNYVRSGGPYPALRCGRQPYGILPVTSLDLWKPRRPSRRVAARRVAARAADHAARRRVAPASRDVLRLGRRSESGRSGRRPRRRHADRRAVARLPARAACSAATILQHLRAFLGEDLHAPASSRRRTRSRAHACSQLGIHVAARARCGTVPAEPRGRSRRRSCRPARYRHGRDLEPNYIAALLAEPHDRRAGRHASRSGRAECNDQPAADAAAPCAAARARERGRASSRPAHRASMLTQLLRDVEMIDLDHRRAADHALEAAAGSASARRRRQRTIRQYPREPRRLRRAERRRARRIPRQPRVPARVWTPRRCSTSQRARSICRRIGSTPGSRRSRPSGWRRCERPGPTGCLRAAATAGSRISVPDRPLRR